MFLYIVDYILGRFTRLYRKFGFDLNTGAAELRPFLLEVHSCSKKPALGQSASHIYFHFSGLDRINTAASPLLVLP